ncbi:hypothetical protein AGDE_07686 [Angomonas deanei]|nr:hypothetical protein AGDE_11438 [Angomonas deanei]EPY33431.1 hypothetical protein AGDE_08287 [Angomonas deanei]EPY34950.1 hypothetical protein AGDE_07686 [Angomonas deanei]|eukprot:EPY26304.1 hypothetical protein AGDE_11438 [Angomonas deanei]
MMLSKLKPLYGIVSREFVQEQKRSIKDSIQFAKDVSYDNAFYSSLFNIGDAESITDVIAGFFIQWVFNYILVYPFAVLYYAFWTAPRSVYAYSSGITDIVPGVVAYVVSVAVMCAPLVVLLGGMYLVKRKYDVDLRTGRAGRRRYY